MKRISWVLAVICCSCAHLKNIKTISASTHLKLLDVDTLPHLFKFHGTTVGGLSGIDYDPNTQIYYLICDDRSAINPARFYKARISISGTKIDSVSFLEVDTLRMPGGSAYPDSKTDPQHTPDPEALRVDAKRNLLVWSSEGERIHTASKTVMQDPGVYRISTNGQFVDSITLPSNMHIRYDSLGPRQNGVFEGLTFNNDYSKLYVSVEEPLIEDGPRAGTGDSTGIIRIFEHDLKKNKNGAQYAYLIDAVKYVPQPASAFKVNGVPDILWVGKNQILVMERSFSTGRRPCSIRLYLADLSSGSDVSAIASLARDQSWKPVNKKLILDLDELGIYTDNVEGVCFGPRLANGHRSLILVADDNFAEGEVSQFFLFEIE